MLVTAYGFEARTRHHFKAKEELRMKLIKILKFIGLIGVIIVAVCVAEVMVIAIYSVSKSFALILGIIVGWIVGEFVLRKFKNK